MNTFHKREINPKTAFFILSLSGFLLLSLSIPLLSKSLLNEGKDAGIIFSDSLIVWSFCGLIAGTGFAVFGIKKFSEELLIKLIRYSLILILLLTFLVYISIKAAEY